MNALKLATLGLAMISLASCAGIAQTASVAPMRMSAADHKQMEACMAMSSDVMMKNESCKAMMQKMNMSEMDMKKMMSCKAMPKDAMMKDVSCSSMMQMHPDMMMGMEKK